MSDSLLKENLVEKDSSMGRSIPVPEQRRGGGEGDFTQACQLLPIVREA